MAYQQQHPPGGGYPQQPYGTAQYAPPNQPPPNQGYYPHPGGYPPPPGGYGPPHQQQYAPPPNQHYYPPPAGSFPPPPGPPPPNQQHPPPPPPGGHQYPGAPHYPPQQHYPPQGQPQYYPPPGQHYGAPPMQQPYQQQALPYGQAPVPFSHIPTVPNPNYPEDIKAIYNACKGFGCDELAVIRVLATRDAATIDAIRNNYKSVLGKGSSSKDLIATLKSETRGDLETALVATALGRVEMEAFWANRAMRGFGFINSNMLMEAVLGKPNVEIQAIKAAYAERYKKQLSADVKSALTGNTESLFLMALEGRRMEEHVPVQPANVERDVKLLYKAGEGRLGTNESAMFNILINASDAHLRALSIGYEQTYRKSLRDAIKSEFSGTQETALKYIIDGAVNRPRRDAKLLEDAMKGLGTDEDLLTARIVRIHWDPQHMEAVKREYQSMYGTDLIRRVKGETSGNYERMLVTLLGGT